MLFGFKMCKCTLACPFLYREVIAPDSTFSDWVLPPPVGPTSISPCLTCIVSYSCITLSMNPLTGIKFSFYAL